MPELPEVETVVRDLRGAVTGRRVLDVQLGHPKPLRHPTPEAFVAGLRDAAITGVERRGKFIVIRLDTGDDLVVHLGMTGHLTVCDAGAPAAPHTHLRARLDDGRELRFDDARRFGRLLLGGHEALREAGVLPLLGMEPLAEDFTWERFDALLRSTVRSVKSALLDQRGVAGLGNIYVDEACHLAGVRPGRRCNRLTRRERLALFEAIPVVLERAIRNRGTTFDDYRDVWSARGGHQEALQVYGRGGDPCFRCGTPIRRTVVGGRGTHFCPGCQR